MLILYKNSHLVKVCVHTWWGGIWRAADGRRTVSGPDLSWPGVGQVCLEQQDWMDCSYAREDELQGEGSTLML